jgi:quercetin dioxygenase-like cupin family protein
MEIAIALNTGLNSLLLDPDGGGAGGKKRMTTKYDYIENLTDLVPEILKDSIVSRTFYEDERLKVILFGFSEGQELSEHTASQPAMLHFLEGEAMVKLGADEHHAHAGTWIHMPAHLPHSVQANKSTLMLLILYQDLG